MRSIAGLVVLCLGLVACAGPSISRHLKQRLKIPAARTLEGETLPLLVYLPLGYHDLGRETERWPVVLFLHGTLAEGSEPSYIVRSGLPRMLEDGLEVPFIVAAPQLSHFAQKWRPRHVLATLDHLERRYRIDRDRVHLTGISAGGSTGWDVVKARPDLFASFVPVVAWASARGVERMRDVPVWAFQGRFDPFAPPPVVTGAIAAHRAAGGRARLTLITKGFHWIWRSVYERPDLWAWWAAQRRPPVGLAKGGCAAATPDLQQRRK